MGPAHLSVTPASVYAQVHRTVSGVLDWSDYKASVTRVQIVDLLVYMASTARTLSAAVRRRFPFCPETGRRAVHSQLPAAADLTAGLAAALHGVLAFSRLDRRRRWTVAIDTHAVPYYGDRATPGITGGPKKQGTHYFFAYATAVLLHRRRRYTVGLIDAAGLRPHEIVAALFAQIDRHGLAVKGVVLDSAFGGGDTLLWLQGRTLGYAVPLRRAGTGVNRRNACFAWAHGTVGTVEWTTDVSRRAVSVRVLVWRLAAKKGAAKKGSKERMRVFAFSGWGDAEAVAERRRAWLARRRYRERFAIETSYRQKNAMRGWTTGRDARYRLLLEGIAHLLRQVWIVLTEAIARARQLKPTDWIADFTGQDLTDWLRERLENRYASQRGIPLASSRLT